MAKPAFKFEIHGLKETMAAFEQLPTLSMKKRIVANALKKSALPIQEAAQANLDTFGVNFSVVGAKLKKSIKISSGLKRSQRGRVDRSRVTEYVGSSHPLAHLFEFGTAERYTKSGAYRGYIPPMPFLRQAWDSKKKIALDRIGEEMWRALEKAAKLLNKKAQRGTLTSKQRAGLMK